ncbi:MAG: FecR domain-containing protein [Opitutus sp.]
MKAFVKSWYVNDVEAAASAWIARRDAGMSVAEEAEFASWGKDPHHAAALVRHEKTWRHFDWPMQRGQGPGLARQFRARIARRRRATAAVAVLSCLLTAGLAWRFVSPERADPVAKRVAIVVLPERQMLPDGSIVELMPGSEIAVDYSERFRRVSLRRGAAHYQVSHDAVRPFVVDAAGVEIRAVGTAFSVELGQQAVAILVTEGRVSVASEVKGQESEFRAATDENPAEQAEFVPVDIRSVPEIRPPTVGVLVDAGNRLVVDLLPEAAAPPRLAPVGAPEVAERLAWRAPRLEFTAAPLAEAIALMNRYNRVQFVIDDPALAALKVSGYFRADNHETFLSLIEQGLGLESERRGGKILLRQSP